MAFVDKGKFEAMKTLSGLRAPRYDKHQFYAKMEVSTLNHLRDLVVEYSDLKVGLPRIANRADFAHE